MLHHSTVSMVFRFMRACLVVAGLLLLTGFMLPAQSLAQSQLQSQGTEQSTDPVLANASPEAIRGLIDDLQNEPARKELIGKLELMLEAQSDAPEGQTAAETANDNGATAEEGFRLEVSDDLTALRSSVVETLSKALATLGRQMAELATLFANLPALWDWVMQVVQIDNPTKSALEANFIIVCAAAFALGLLIEFFLRWIGKPISDRQLQTSHFSTFSRLLGLIGWVVMQLILVAGFAAGAYGVLVLSDLPAASQSVILTLVSITVASRVVIVLLRGITMPHAANTRVLPISDETAGYFYVWGKRLTVVAVYGFFLGQLALINGLPEGAYLAWTKLVGLTLALMAIIIVLQNRQTVEDWIRAHATPRVEPTGTDTDDAQEALPGMEEEAAPVQPASSVRSRNIGSRGMRLLVSWFADLWHVLAIIYIVAIYGTWALDIPGGFEILAASTVQTIILAVLGYLIMRLADKGITKGFTIPADMAERMPGLEQRVNRYVPVIRLIARIIIWGCVLLGILDAWGFETAAWLLSDAGLALLNSTVSLLLIISLALAMWELVSSAIERKLQALTAEASDIERASRLRTLLPLAKSVFSVVLATIVILVLLSEVGVNIGPLLAGAGIIGVAVGFGSQKLVQDVITGLFILIEDQVSIGDYIDTGSHGGVVEQINLRTIRLRDFSGTVHIVPFSDVSSIKNFSREFAFAVMDIGVAYREDVDEVIALIERIGAELQEDETHGPQILEPIVIFGVDQFGDSAVVIKARIKVKPMMQWSIRRAFNRLMKKRFDEHGIEIPFPHQTIYFGELKDGTAPPAYVVNAKGRRVSGDNDAIIAVTEEEKDAAVANLATDVPETD